VYLMLFRTTGIAERSYTPVSVLLTIKLRVYYIQQLNVDDDATLTARTLRQLTIW